MLSSVLSEDDHCSILASTSVHAVLNVLLLLLLLISTGFKLYRGVKRHSIKALSFSYLFLGALFNVSQVCIAITGSIVELGIIDCHRYLGRYGLGTLNTFLLLLMTGISLIISLALYSIGLSCAPTEPPAERDSQLAEDRSPAPEQARSSVPGKPVLHNIILGLYIIAFLIPNLLALVVARSNANVGLYMYLKPAFYFHLTTLPFLAIGQFIPQLRMLWRERHNMDRLPLDIPIFALDTLLFILIGISWRQLLAETYPLVLLFWYGLAHPLSWQQYGAWMWFNYVVFGLGQGLVSSLYLSLRHRYGRKFDSQKGDLGEQDEDVASETAPLLH